MRSRVKIVRAICRLWKSDGGKEGNTICFRQSNDVRQCFHWQAYPSKQSPLNFPYYYLPKSCFLRKVFPEKTSQVIGWKALYKFLPRPVFFSPTDPTDQMMCRIYHGRDRRSPQQLTIYNLQLTWVVGASPRQVFRVFRGNKTFLDGVYLLLGTAPLWWDALPEAAQFWVKCPPKAAAPAGQQKMGCS